MGLGKQEPLTSLIPTPNGFVPMGQLEVGDSIFSDDGTPTLITGVFPQQSQRVYRVHFSDGSYTDAGPDHLWLVNDQNGNKRQAKYGTPWRTLTTKEIKNRGLLNQGKSHSGSQPKFWIPRQGPVQYPHAVLPMDPYFLGFLIANGCYTKKSGCGSVVINNNDIEEVARRIPTPTRVDSPSTGCVRFSYPKGHLKHWWECGLKATTSRFKTIPASYMTASIDQRLELLRGLMDADGSCSRQNQSNYHTRSKKLAKQVKQLVDSLGGYASIHSYPRDTGVDIAVFIQMDVSPFHVSRKATNWKPVEAKRVKKRCIVRINRRPNQPTQCISVNNPRHLYLTGKNYVVTHNTLQSLTWFDWNFGDDALCIVICPASLKYNWEREALTHIGVRAAVCSGRKPPKRRSIFVKHRIIIINYDILADWREYLSSLKPDLIIIDEAHFCKNPESQRSRNVTALCKEVPHIIALTGTPLTNRPAELFPILHILWPKHYSKFQRFAWKYCDPQRNFRGYWEYKGAKNLDLLHARLKKRGMIRRLKRDVLKDLPPITHNVVLLDIKNRKEYDDAEKDFIQWLQKKSPAKANKAMRAERMVKRGYLRRLIGELKLQAVKEWIDTFFEETDDKLIIFGIHKKVLKPLQEHYHSRSVLLDGSVTGRKRQLAVDKFQKAPKTKLILANVQAGGTGYTLTASRTVGMIEIPWTPGEVNQAVARAHRISQTRGVMCYYLVVRDTIEYDLIRLIQHKQGILDNVLDGGVPANSGDLMDLLDLEIEKRSRKT